MVFQNTVTASTKIQENRSALNRASREVGIIGINKEFGEMKLKRSDAACTESLTETLFHWHWGPIEIFKRTH